MKDSFQPAVESKLPSWTEVLSSWRHPPLFWRCAAASDGCLPLKHKTSPHCTFAEFLSWKRTLVVYETVCGYYLICFFDPLWLSPAMIVARDPPVSSPLKAPSSRLSAASTHRSEQRDSTFFYRRLLKTHARSEHRRNRLRNQNEGRAVVRRSHEGGLESIRIQYNAFVNNPKCDNNSPWLQLLKAEL